jgi:hypothetical protein
MAESAARSGHPVIALDAFGDRDLEEPAESYSLRRDFGTAYSPAALYEAGGKLKFDAIAYTANLENYPEVLARFGEEHKIIGNPPRIVAAVRNWAGLFERLRRAGFPVPETVFYGDPMPGDPGRRWLVKPLRSGGGRGIRFHDPETERSRGDENRQCIPGFVLQEYIPGRACSAAFVADGRECAVLGITEQLIGVRPFGSRDFRYSGSLLPIPETLGPGSGKTILEKVRRLAAFLTREYGLMGVNGIDFILRDGQVYLTEVNPRYSASMEIIETAYGLPVFQLHLQSVLKGELPGFELAAAWKPGRFRGKGYIFAERDVAMPDTRGWPCRGIRDVPASGELIRREGPVCTVLAEGAGREETLADLIRRAEEIKEEIYG